MRKQLVEKCGKLKKERVLKFDCRTTNEKLQEFIDKYSTINESSIDSKSDTKERHIDPAELDPAELQSYCNENIDKCSKQEFWLALLNQNFPDISLIVDLEFPDLEEGLRDKRRKFMPLRELYSQLLVISSNDTQLDLLQKALNNELIDREIDQGIEKNKDFIRNYFQLLSFLMAKTSDVWKRYLVTVNDSLLEYISFSVKELERNLSYIQSSILTKKYLSMTDSDPSVDNNRSIQLAAANGRAEVVKLLLADPRVDPTAFNNLVIRLAVVNDHEEVVKLLLADPRVDPTDNNNHAIRFAAANGRAEVVKLLLADPRVDPTDKSNHAIRSAAANGHAEVVKLLLADPRVDPSANNNKAIQLAAKYDHAEVVKLLLADPRVQDTLTPQERKRYEM